MTSPNSALDGVGDSESRASELVEYANPQQPRSGQPTAAQLDRMCDAVIDIANLLRDPSRCTCYHRVSHNNTSTNDPDGSISGAHQPAPSQPGQPDSDERSIGDRATEFEAMDVEANTKYQVLKTASIPVDYLYKSVHRQSADSIHRFGNDGLLPFYSSSPKWNTLPTEGQTTADDTSGIVSSNQTSQSDREEVSIAFFDFEVHQSHMPFIELEMSYQLYLPLGWTAYHQHKLCIDLGRYFRRILWQDEETRPSGHLTSWDYINERARRCTLQHLLEWCTPRSQAFHADGPETDKAILWLHIYRIICDTNHVSILDPEAANFHEPLNLDMPIFEVLEKAYQIPRDFISEKPTTPYMTHKYFKPADFSYSRLIKQGNLRLEWTHFYREHLQLDEGRQTLSVFWDIGAIEQSGLFWYPPHNYDAFALNLSVYFHRQNLGRGHSELYNLNYVTELEMTYRLLFSPKSSLSSTKFNHDKSDDYGVLIKYQYNNVDGANGDHRTRIDFTSPRVKKVLEHYFSMPIPPEHADPRNCPHYDSISCPKIASLLKRGAPYPIDMYMHMDALLKPLACPTLYAPRDKELYSDYPTFATRLRELEFYLNNQKPRNLRQAWQDRRDTVGYFTFWSVIFVGVATIVLALISIAISTAQTVATFQALNVSPSNQ